MPGALALVEVVNNANVHLDLVDIVHSDHGAVVNSTTLTSGGLEAQHVNIVHNEDDDLVGLALVEVILGGNDDHFVHNHVDGVQIDLGVSIDLNIAITKTADI